MSNVTPRQFTDDLLTSFTTFWAGRTPLAYPNVDFDPASEVGDDPSAAWVRIFIQGADPGVQRFSNSVQNDHYARAGRVVYEIYVRQAASTDLAYDLADAILEWFQKPEVPNALFLNFSDPVEIGPDGTWFQVTLSADWVYFTDRPARS